MSKRVVDAHDEYFDAEANQKLVYQIENGDESLAKSLPSFGIRHFQVFIYFTLGFLAFGFRVTLSIAIVAMTDPMVSSNPDIPTYSEWTNKNVILSSFFWGYIMPQLFAAWMAKKFGPKWFLIGSTVIQSILYILLPYTAARFGSTGVIVSRIFQGLSQGFIFPSFAYLLCQWAPIEERSRLGSTVFASGKLGTVFAMFLTGTISASKLGWPLVFYVFGGLGLLWCILMVFFGYDSPGDHPTISAQEKKFIEGSLGKSEDNKHDKTPWKKILTSRHVWALLLAQTGNNYCFWTLVTQIPTYMNYVMHFNMKKNSLLSSLPYLALWVLSIVFGVISDAVVNREIVKRGAARKLFTSIGLMIPAAALIYLGYTDSSQPLQAVVLLVVAVGFNAACFCGFTINHMDLSPNHAGSLMGLCNAFSQIAGAAAPLVVQLIVKNESDVFQWRNVFFLSAGINVFTSVVFIIFGSGSVQSWDKEEDNKDED